MNTKREIVVTDYLKKCLMTTILFWLGTDLILLSRQETKPRYALLRSFFGTRDVSPDTTSGVTT